MRRARVGRLAIGQQRLRTRPPLIEADHLDVAGAVVDAVATGDQARRASARALRVHVQHAFEGLAPVQRNGLVHRARPLHAAQRRVEREAGIAHALHRLGQRGPDLGRHGRIGHVQARGRLHRALRVEGLPVDLGHGLRLAPELAEQVRAA